MALCSSIGVAPLVSSRTRTAAPRSRCQIHINCTSHQAEPHRATNKVEAESIVVQRRGFCSLCGALALAPVNGFFSENANAVQGFTAGRIPGTSEEPDSNGFYTYTRPEGKSGGHGVGWSEIPQYSFKLPGGWEEEPVSIADLGGTEIDLRFGSSAQGQLFVVVAPVLRFLDVGFNSEVRIDEVGPPEKLIEGFAPELFGKPLEEDDVLATNVVERGPLTYYKWEVKPHNLVTATAVGNRVFILGTTSNGRQWRKSESALRTIQDSFIVPKVA